MQYLGADSTSTTLAVEGFKDEARGGGDIPALSRTACFAFKRCGTLLPLQARLAIAISSPTTGQWCMRRTGKLTL